MNSHPWFRVGLALIFSLVQGCAAPSVETSVRAIGGDFTADESVLPTQRCGDYFVVAALINGSGPYPMLLDTGAGTTVLSPSAAREIGVSGRMKSVQIDRFRANGSIPCVVREVDHLSRALGLEIQGILAYGVFEGVLLTYDYPQQEIRVQAGAFTSNELNHSDVVPTSAGDRPFVRASVGGNDFTVLLDTGSSRGLTLTALDRFAFEGPLVDTGARMRINGLFLVRSGRLLHDMKLGPLNLHRALVNNSVSINLAGQRILRNFVITFDQVNHHVRFANPVGLVSDPISFASLYGSGLVTAPGDESLVVRKIFADSAGHRAGILLDDEILAINGTAISDRGCRHLEFRPHGKAETVEYLIRRKGKQISIGMVTDVMVP